MKRRAPPGGKPRCVARATRCVTSAADQGLRAQNTVADDALRQEQREHERCGVGLHGGGEQDDGQRLHREPNEGDDAAAASKISTAPTNMSETTAAAMTANDAPKSTDAP